MAKLLFAGAAGEVTGSRHLLEIAGRRLLLDCGLFQGHRHDSENKNRKFIFNPASVDAVILSHAHLDHTGNLPLLVKQGFKGRIYCTPATAELVSILLADSANIQQKDAEFFNKKHPQNKIQPLYTPEDIEAVSALLSPEEYGREFQPLPGVSASFIEAGHILGSAQVCLKWSEGENEKKFVFTGDLGRLRMPIVRDPAIPPQSDVLVMESTYGNREHDDIGNASEALREAILRTVKRGGKVFIPAFALGRAQEIASMLEDLHQKGDLGRIPVYVDSPLAEKTTAIFAKHAPDLDEGYQALARRSDPFGKGWVHYISDQQDSVRLNKIKTPVVIVAPSGMCEGGRILHHLRNNIGDSKNTVILVGFQAEGTLGRKLAEGAKEVLIFGMPVSVRAEIIMAHEYSAHAGAAELLSYASSMKSRPGQAFMVHGEPDAAKALADKVSAAGIPAHVAVYGETVEI